MSLSTTSLVIRRDQEMSLNLLNIFQFKMNISELSLQLMMLPGTAMRDIMVHNVMTPFANLFRTRGHVHSSRGRREAGTGWSREQRRRFWRALGELARSETGDQRGEEGDQPTTFTMPPDQSNVPKSRNRRSIVGLYSYAPWLTNDVRVYPPTTNSQF